MSVEYRAQVLICNKLGLHLRAAAQFVKVANRFGCDVTVQHGSLSVNGKSIMSLATLAAAQGVSVHITTRGADAEPALRALVALVEQGFGEE